MKHPPGSADTYSASVLVVDDSRLSARKLALAMRGLGHSTEIAESGAAALDLLRVTPFDVVLLDIIMPGMDGYEVLRRLKADDMLQHIPVIVISSLDDDTASIVKAIELGAEDFLPKTFEPEILRARLDASLSRKRFRDRELEDLARVEQLTSAAQVIEAGSFHPSDLEIENVAERDDAIGRLANVFRGLAAEVYERERQLDQKARTFRGAILVVVVGLLLGIRPAVARMISAGDAPILGIAFWSTLAGGVTCLALATALGGLPRYRQSQLKFLFAWALVLGCFYQLGLILISGEVEAIVISIVASSRAFLVFGLAALIALERPSFRRLSGLAVGFGAVTVMLLFGGGVSSKTDYLWAFATLALPLLLAIHTLIMSYRPSELGALAATGAMLTLSALMFAPFAAVGNAMHWPGLLSADTWGPIILFGLTTGLGLAISLDIVRTAGPVFAGQVAYSQALAGVAWAMLLLGEQPSLIVWGAVVLVIFGFFLVEPKRAGDKFRATLSSVSSTPMPLAHRTRRSLKWRSGR